MLELIRDLLAFARERRKLWLLPVIVICLFFAVLVVIAPASPLAPFLYTLF
jgi:hypothetical protein